MDLRDLKFVIGIEVGEKCVESGEDGEGGMWRMED